MVSVFMELTLPVGVGGQRGKERMGEMRLQRIKESDLVNLVCCDRDSRLILGRSVARSVDAFQLE